MFYFNKKEVLNKPKVAVLMAVNDNMDFALANTLIGLKRYNHDLIDKIFIMHDLKEETRNKISEIWGGDIIEFIEYKYENFLKDIDYKDYLIPKDRFGYLIYAKFYLFNFIDSKFDYVIWLDADVLVTKKINSVFNSSGISWKSGYQNGATAIRYIKECLKEDVDEQFISSGNEGVIVINNNVIKKTNNFNMTNECFMYLIELFRNNIIINKQSTSDGTPMSLIVYFNKISYSYIDGLANTFPQENNLKSSIIHAGTDRKIWNSPVSNAVYQEWWVNHKIWHYNYLKDDDLYSKINVRKSNIPIDNIDNLHHWLYNMNIVSPLLGKLSYVLASKYSEYKFYLKLPMVNNYLDIYNTLFQDQLFYRLAFSHGHSEHETRVQIQAICTNIGLIDNGIKELFEMYVSYNNDYELKSGKENGKDNIYITSPKYKIEYDNVIKQLILFISKTSNHFFNINLFFKTVNSDEY